MGRHLIAAAVVVVDTVLFLSAHRSWAVVAYALATVLVVVLRTRSPVAAFVAALALASLSGGSYILLLWSAYQAGQEVLSRSGVAVVAGAGAGGLAVRLAAGPLTPQAVGTLLSTYLVFVALPLLVGLYLAQHRRLVAALDQSNRQLRLRRDLLAEQERLRERLRIARDMHDSLGHRLSLVSVQAAALEVSALPVRHRQAVGQLAESARAAMHELHDLVGALRGEEEPSRSLTVEAIGTVTEEFRRAGVPVTLRERGRPRPLSFAAGQAAYRVVEEGLTNAAKHAPRQPVTVTVDWESDALLLTVVNPLPERPETGAGDETRAGVEVGWDGLSGPGVSGLGSEGSETGAGASDLGALGPEVGAEAGRGDVPGSGSGGHGLAGLAERVRPAGGVLDHRLSDDGFRLFAMLPVTPLEDDLVVDDLPAVGRVRTVALGAAVAVLMFVTLPASLLLGVVR
ncbi:histidine kinase [Streptosporangium sp. NPDC020145]|uniref:sensor histidine kinase n=1 Tax=Streptosporangium sp. NPDC020145 TaxID=3154694 RepID=UPI00341C7CAE